MNYSTIVEREFKKQKRTYRGQAISLFVPIDFSESSYISLGYAMRLASICGAKIDLFHVIDASLISRSENPLTIQRELKEIELKAKKSINSLCEIIAENGVQVSSELQIGSKSSLIKQQIKKLSPGIIVVGKDSAMLRLIVSSKYMSKQPRLIIPPSINPTLPSKVLMIRDNLPIQEHLLKPLSVIMDNDFSQLTVIDIKHNLFRRLMFKYFVSIEGVEIGINRKFHNIKSSGDDLVDLITKHKPDLVCRIARHDSFLDRVLKFPFRGNSKKDFDVPTLLIPAS